jgi:hypothetical protein
MLRRAAEGECEVGRLAAEELVRGRVRVLGTHTVAPALCSRLMVSVRNDFAPRVAPAGPPRSREKITCPGSASVASCGW